jgi:flagellar biosynthesis protein FlhG
VASGVQKVIELAARLADRPEGETRPALGIAPPGLARRARPRRIIAVGGGKGGIGKSLVSANLGVALAQAGERVVLVDADLGGANLHTCLGVSQPTATLSDFVNRKADRLEDVLVPAGIPNLSLIAGALDVLDAANPKHKQKVKLLRNLQALDADYLVLDLGAGTSFNVLDFFLIADHGVLVLLPEPTSVENAYRFVKSALFRKLLALGEELGVGELLPSLLITKEGGLRPPQELLDGLTAHDAQLVQPFQRALDSFRLRLVLNQARGAPDEKVGQAVVAAWKRFFGLPMDYLGAIPHDDEAWRAIRKRRPLLLERPDCEAARALRALAERLRSMGSAFETSVP